MAKSHFMRAAAVLVLLAGVSVQGDVFQGKSAPVQVTAPKGWLLSPPGKDDDASLALMITDKTQNIGVMVLYEPASTLDLTLNDYGKTVLNQMTDRLTDTSHTDWKPVKVSGFDGLRCELRGVRSNIKLAYLLTVVKSKDSYDQVIAFTMQSAFAGEKKELVKISDSFRVSPAAVPADNAPECVIKGKDNTVELHLPGSWQQMESNNADAQLMAQNKLAGTFVLVITEDRKDLTFTLPEYADKAVEGILSSGTDGSKTDWKKLKINGNDAVQCDIKLTVGHVKVGYVMTAIETAGNFHQVLTWSLASSFDANRPALLPVANGLKELAKQ